MTFQTWGQTPIVTTVSASPTPTTTVFTVASALDLVENQYILVDVAGNDERVQIQDITGNQITLASALSGTPTVPGSVKSGRELMKNTKLNQMAMWPADDVADLQATDTTNMKNGTRAYIKDFGPYYLDTSSVLVADGYNVIDTTTGPGKWIRDLGGGNMRAFATVAAAKAVDTTGITYSYKVEITDYGIYIFDPTSTLTADDITVIAPTTGTGRYLLTYATPDIVIGMIDEELELINEVVDRIADTYLGSIFTIASISWTSIATISLQTQTVVCIGARVGDIVVVGMPDLDTSNRFSLQYVGVKTDDVITITVRNNHTASLTPNTGTWKFEVRRTSL